MEGSSEVDGVEYLYKKHYYDVRNHGNVTTEGISGRDERQLYGHDSRPRDRNEKHALRKTLLMELITCIRVLRSQLPTTPTDRSP